MIATKAWWLKQSASIKDTTFCCTLKDKDVHTALNLDILGDFWLKALRLD